MSTTSTMGSRASSSSQSKSMRASTRDLEGYTLKEIPPFVQLTSPVFSQDYGHGPQLPLNLVARIVGYLDDVGDLARVTRTSRLLYYMALPQLYERVALHSYPDIRYVDGRPEGYGSGSPFMMALNGLVTKNHAGVVRDFRIWGEWREVGVEAFSKGRVPDNSMMLNMMLRMCVTRMAKLRSFSWELDNKPLKILYEGLAVSDTLTKLTLKFPTSRVPRPTVIVPPMPNMKFFAAIDIDPLCYPDDISYLIAGSKKLIDLRLHFVPRIRREAENTLHMEAYFGRCFQNSEPLKLKHIAGQNWFGRKTLGTETVFQVMLAESMTFLDFFGGVHGNDANVYTDDTWNDMPPDFKFYYRTMRFNEFVPQHVALVRNSKGAEKVYIVGNQAGSPAISTTGGLHARSSKSGRDYITPEDSPSSIIASTATTGPSTASTTASLGSGSGSGSGSSSSDRAALRASFGPLYLDAFTTCHGATLQHFLLSPDWALTSADLVKLVSSCPNLTQLGLALAEDQFESLRLLIPFLPKIYALRILDPDGTRAMSTASDEEVARFIGRDTYIHNAMHIKWVEDLGRFWKIGEVFEALLEDGSGRTEMRKRVQSVPREELAQVEIWKLDTLDMMADEGPNCWLWILLRRWIWLVFLPLPLVAKIQHQWIAQHRCQQPAYEDPGCLINETVHQFLETSPAMFRTWFRRTKHYGSSVSYFRSASLTRNTTDLEHRTKKHVSSSLTKQRDKSQIHMRSPKLYRGTQISESRTSPFKQNYRNMKSHGDNKALDDHLSSPYTFAEIEAVSQLTGELFCTNILKTFYFAAIRDDDIGAGKLYEQLRHDLKTLGLFLKAEDRALWKVAEALQDQMISNGIAHAVVAYAQEVILKEGVVSEEPDAGDLPSTGEHGLAEDPSATTGDLTCSASARLTFHLDPPTAHAILDLGAYTTLTPPIITLIQHSKRYLSLRTHLLDLVFTAYSQRLASAIGPSAIGPSAIGEDGQSLRWSRLRTTIDELSRTPPHKISYAAHGTKTAEVVWISPPGEHKFKAPELREGFCRVKWTSREGFVRFVDVRVGAVRGVMEGVWSAPRVKGSVS
ncbi:hypothetical protein Q7P35_006685 [Cladosporium inversicolor]